MNLGLVTEVIFWLGAAAFIYTYVGYLLLLAILSKLRPLGLRRAEWLPVVSVIITAYNEERVAFAAYSGSNSLILSKATLRERSGGMRPTVQTAS